MTFANPRPAYAPGVHVRCDVCRDPDALMEGRVHSEVVLQTQGTDEATWAALSHGFVRRAGRVLCGGCVKVAGA